MIHLTYLKTGVTKKGGDEKHNKALEPIVQKATSGTISRWMDLEHDSINIDRIEMHPLVCGALKMSA